MRSIGFLQTNPYKLCEMKIHSPLLSSLKVLKEPGTLQALSIKDHRKDKKRVINDGFKVKFGRNRWVCYQNRSEILDTELLYEDL